MIYLVDEGLSSGHSRVTFHNEFMTSTCILKRISFGQATKYKVLMLICTLFSHLSICGALEQVNGLVDSNTKSHDGTETCGFTGNADIYGIGIRIGYYAQAFSVLIARFFVPQEAQSLRANNLLFLLAVFIGVAWLCHVASSVYAIEPFILINLLLATWHCGIGDRTTFTRVHTAFSPATDIIATLTMWGLCGFYVWYFWVGLDEMHGTPCGTEIFLFARLNLYGWVRKVQKIVSIQFVIGCSYLQTKDFLTMVRVWKVDRHLDAEFFIKLEELLKIKHALLAKEDEALAEKQKPTTSPFHLTSESDCQLEIAALIPLPPSPKATSAPRPPSASHIMSQLVQQQIPTVPSFEDLISAERYLQDLFNTKVSERNSNTLTLAIPRLGDLSISYYSPKFLIQYSRLYLLPLFTRSYPQRFSDILLPAFAHLHSFRHRPYKLYMKIMHEAMQHPLHQTVDPLAVGTVLAFHKTRVSPSRPWQSYLTFLLWSLCVWMFLIVSIELALVWNRITGMGAVGTVGQLIPAILGVGGLVRVLWIWCRNALRGTKHVKQHNHEDDESGVKQCEALYEGLKAKKDVTKDLRLQEA